MEKVTAGVKTKVLMLSPRLVNNASADLRHQLALAYKVIQMRLEQELKTKTSVERDFRRAQTASTVWSDCCRR